MRGTQILRELFAAPSLWKHYKAKSKGYGATKPALQISAWWSSPCGEVDTCLKEGTSYHDYGQRSVFITDSAFGTGCLRVPGNDGSFGFSVFWRSQ